MMRMEYRLDDGRVMDLPPGKWVEAKDLEPQFKVGDYLWDGLRGEVRKVRCAYIDHNGDRIVYHFEGDYVHQNSDEEFELPVRFHYTKEEAVTYAKSLLIRDIRMWERMIETAKNKIEALEGGS